MGFRAGAPFGRLPGMFMMVEQASCCEDRKGMVKQFMSNTERGECGTFL